MEESKENENKRRGRREKWRRNTWRKRRRMKGKREVELKGKENEGTDGGKYIKIRGEWENGRKENDETIVWYRLNVFIVQNPPLHRRWLLPDDVGSKVV